MKDQFFFSIVTDSLLKWIKKRDLRYLSCQNIQSFGRLDTLDIYADEHRDGN